MGPGYQLEETAAAACALQVSQRSQHDVAAWNRCGDKLKLGDLNVETISDWVTVAIFGGMIVLFLHRSTTDEPPKDHIIQYLPPSVGCAVANWFGNHHQEVVGYLIVLAVLAYIAVVLKPFNLKLW